MLVIFDIDRAGFLCDILSTFPELKGEDDDLLSIVIDDFRNLAEKAFAECDDEKLTAVFAFVDDTLRRARDTHPDIIRSLEHYFIQDLLAGDFRGEAMNYISRLASGSISNDFACSTKPK